MKFASARSVLISALWLVPAATAAAQSQPAAPLQVERSVKLSFALHANVPLSVEPAIKEPVALLRFDQPVRPEVSTPAVGRPVVAGGLTWWVSPAGMRVTDRATGSTALTPALTSRSIRPQAIVHDSARGAVWLYGDALYRYRIANGELHRFKPVSHSPGAIRKAVVAAAGVWLATETGALLFDDVTETFRTIPRAGTAPLINAVAVGQNVWLAAEQPRLIKVSPAASGRATIAISDQLPLGVPAEMYGVDDALWLLLSTDHGDAYRVAYVAGGQEQLDVISGRYFSLRQEGGRLVAGAHANLLTIDPQTKTAIAHTFDPIGLAAAGRVMFLGSSYSVKDPSEIVEQRPLDLSRGWSEPELHGASVER